MMMTTTMMMMIMRFRQWRMTGNQLRSLGHSALLLPRPTLPNQLLTVHCLYCNVHNVYNAQFLCTVNCKKRTVSRKSSIAGLFTLLCSALILSPTVLCL